MPVGDYYCTIGVRMIRCKIGLIILVVVMFILSVACDCTNKVCSDGSSWPCEDDDTKYTACVNAARSGYIAPGCCQGFGICNAAMFAPNR